jgi:hypothetical protein
MIRAPVDLSVLFAHLGHGPLVGRDREMNEAQTLW